MKSSMKIEELREKLDQLDYQIIEIIAKRMKVVQKIAKEKIKKRYLVRDVQREKSQDLLISKLANRVGLEKIFVLKMFDFIRKESRKIQSKVLKIKD